jgi:hypothetical protein
MKLLELEQGTPAWHAWRRKHRMASQTPMLLGSSPYGDAGTVWDSRHGQEVTETHAMRKGRDLELRGHEILREKYLMVGGPTCVEVGPWGASIDFLHVSGDTAKMVEIKGCVSPTGEYRKACDGGEIPLSVIHQVSHQAMLLRIGFSGLCVFVLFVHEGGHALRNFTYFPEMAPKIDEAWRWFEAHDERPIHEFGTRLDESWQRAEADYIEAKHRMDIAKTAVAIHRDTLMALAGKTGAKGPKLTVSASFMVDGRVDIDAVEREYGSLNRFRGPPIFNQRIVRVKS